MQRALKPGGLLVLEGYRPEQIAYATGGPSAVENLYTEPMLRAAFADMEIVSLRSHDAVIQEGSVPRGHVGAYRSGGTAATRLSRLAANGATAVADRR